MKNLARGLTAWGAIAWLPLACCSSSNSADSGALPAGQLGDEGYDQARWGMSAQQVRQLYPEAVAENPAAGGDQRLSCLRFETAARSPCTILSFGFVDDRLAYVQQVLFFIGAVRFDPYEAKLHELRRQLTGRYGPPKPPPLLLELFQEAWAETNWESSQTLAVLRYEPGVNAQFYSRALYQPRIKWQDQCGLRRAAGRR
ncbi:MAG: hypothetical protein JXR83_22755 [Deltaproteobacteria bacterium]|nr:hypothetical protein [Deltaproteobacteria bacterium]